MPDTYKITLSDGRTFNVTTEGGPPSEADVLASLGSESKTPDTRPRPVMRAPTTADPVTLGELMDNPTEAIGRIGSILAKDVSDPKTWLTIATAYFGPKVVGKMMPAMGTALMKAGQGAKAGTAMAGRGLAATGDVVHPDVIGMYSPRLANLVRVAQRTRGATPSEAPTVPAPSVEAPPPVPAPPSQVVQTPPPTAPESAPPPAQPMPATKIAPGVAWKQSLDAFKAAGETAQRGEVANVQAFIQRGFSPEEALAKVIAKRPAPTVSAAEAFAAKFGTPSDADVAATVAAKNARTTRAKGGTK